MGAKQILINNVPGPGSNMQSAGSEFDATTDAVLIAQLQANGGVFLPKEIPAVAAAAALATTGKMRGALATNPSMFADIIASSLLADNATQRLTMTLVRGVATVNSGITIRSSTRVLPQLLTPAGTMGAGGIKVAKVVGGPGAGSVTLTAVGLDGSTTTTDTSVYEVTLLG